MTKCVECGATGGKFIKRGRGWVCVKCDTAPRFMDTAKSTFPFVTNNIGNPNHGPIVVNNMRHLRRLENQYGVNSVAYNQDSQNH